MTHATGVVPDLTMTKLSQLSPIQRLVLTERIAKEIAKELGFTYSEDCDFYECAKTNPRAAEHLRMAEIALTVVQAFVTS